MSRLGECRRCGYFPMAKNAIICPQCGVTSPNPGFFTKWFGRLLTVVLIVLAIVIVAAILSQNG